MCRWPDSCGTILDQIAINVSSVKDLMGDVTIAAEEQSKGVKNISDAMNMLDTTTQDKSENGVVAERKYFKATNLSKKENR